MLLNSSLRNTTFFNQGSSVFGLDFTFQDSKNKSLFINGFETRINQYEELRTRLNISKHSGAPTPVAMMPNTSPEAMWRKVLAYIRKNTENVGAAFPEEARKIHYGETAVRNIRGQASLQDVAALSDEGIEVTPIPNIPPLPDKLQ